MRRKALAAGEWLLLGTFTIALRVLGHWYPVQALAVLLGAALTAIAVVLIRRDQARRRRARRVATTGWTRYHPEHGDWPWLGLVVSGKATVTRAWTKHVDGFPVVTGEIDWSGGAFAGAVLARSGRGIFVAVQLPLPAPPHGHASALRIPRRLSPTPAA